MSNDIGQYIYIARVLEVYPATYTARVEVIDSTDNNFGAIVECRILAMRLSSDGAATVNFPMPTDTVYISSQRSKSSPDIVGYVPNVNLPPSYASHQQQLTPLEHIGTRDKNYLGGRINNRNSSPGDVLPGDEISVGKEGQTIANLTGGSLLFKAGALSQIILTKLRSTIKIVSRRLHIFTDFGEIVSESENGAAYLAINGNTTVQKSNKTVGNYDYNIKLGGENMFSASFASVFNNTINKTGGVATTLGYLQTRIKEDSATEYLSSNESIVGLDYTEYTGRNYKQTVKGNLKSHAVGKRNISTTGSHSEIVGGQSRSTYQGIRQEIIKGITVLATDGEAHGINVGMGDYNITIGDLSLGVTPSPVLAGKFGNYNLRIINGDIDMRTYLGKYLAKATIKATVDGGAHVELKALVAALEANMKHLDGLSGSQDPVVTALRLQTEIATKIIATYNSHTHPVFVSTPLGPGSGTASATPSQMSSIDVASISNSTVVA